MKSSKSLAEVFKRTLGQRAEEAANESRWRKQDNCKLTGSSFIGGLVLSCLEKPAPTLGDLGKMAGSLAGEEISEPGLHQRFNDESVKMLELCLERTLAEEFVQSDPVEIEVLRRFGTIAIDDSTTIVLDEQLSAVWEGCGGGNSPAQESAALKVHVRQDLCRGGLLAVLRDHARQPDQGSPLPDVVLPLGALKIADLGFFGLQAFEQLGNSGRYWLSRLLLSTKVMDKERQKLDLLEVLGQSLDGLVDMEVLLGSERCLPARLIAVRIPPPAAAERRRRLWEAAKEKGKAPSKLALAFADWTIAVTNASEDKLQWFEAMVLLKARWQIELLFKLWKQHNGLA